MEEVVDVDEAGQRARFDAQSGLFKNGHGVESPDDDGTDALRADRDAVEVLSGVAEAEQAAGRRVASIAGLPARTLTWAFAPLVQHRDSISDTQLTGLH